MKTARITLAGEVFTVGRIDFYHVYLGVGDMAEEGLRHTLAWHVLQLCDYAGLPDDLVFWARGNREIEGNSYEFARRIR